MAFELVVYVFFEFSIINTRKLATRQTKTKVVILFVVGYFTVQLGLVIRGEIFNTTVRFIDLGKLNLLIISLPWSKSVKQTVILGVQVSLYH
jgi:hypothetical protein